MRGDYLSDAEFYAAPVYGTKAFNFPRDREFSVSFQYGGSFTYFDEEHLEILSQSGVRTSVPIATAPETTAGGMFLTAALSLLLRRWRRRLRRFRLPD